MPSATDIAALGGLVLALAKFFLAERRKATITARQTEAIQNATARATYEKTRLEVIKLIKEQVPAEEITRAVNRLSAIDEGLENSLAVSVRRGAPKWVSILLAAYSVAIIVFSLSDTSSGWEERLFTALFGVVLLWYAARGMSDWSGYLKKCLFYLKNLLKRNLKIKSATTPEQNSPEPTSPP